MLNENDIVILTITTDKVFTLGGFITKIVENDDGEEVIYITTDSNMYMRFEGGKFYFTGSSAPGTLALDEKRMKLLRA